MSRKVVYFIFTSALLFFFATPCLSADYGIQYGPKFSTIGGNPTSVGFKILQEDYAITPRVGMYYYDIQTKDYDESMMWWTLGSTFDYYLTDEKLRHYVGGDIDFHFWDLDDSEISLSIAPHFGTEYWLTDKFTLSGEVGILYGFGELYDIENRMGTTGALLVTYYF